MMFYRLKSDLRGIETRKKMKKDFLRASLKSDLRGIETFEKLDSTVWRLIG